MQYVGSTINKFRIRFNNHKSRLNSHVKLTAENRVKDDIIYKHFNQRDHRGLKDVRIQLVDKGSNERSLRERAGGVRHGPQRVMGKNITDVHFTLGTME